MQERVREDEGDEKSSDRTGLKCQNRVGSKTYWLITSIASSTLFHNSVTSVTDTIATNSAGQMKDETGCLV